MADMVHRLPLLGIKVGRPTDSAVQCSAVQRPFRQHVGDGGRLRPPGNGVGTGAEQGDGQQRDELTYRSPMRAVHDNSEKVRACR